MKAKLSNTIETERGTANIYILNPPCTIKERDHRIVVVELRENVVGLIGELLGEKDNVELHTMGYQNGKLSMVDIAPVIVASHHDDAIKALGYEVVK